MLNHFSSCQKRNFPLRLNGLVLILDFAICNIEKLQYRPFLSLILTVKPTKYHPQQHPQELTFLATKLTFSFLQITSWRTHRLDLLEHPDEVEPGKLLQVLHTPVARVEQCHKELRVMADIWKPHGDPVVRCALMHYSRYSGLRSDFRMPVKVWLFL